MLRSLSFLFALALLFSCQDSSKEVITMADYDRAVSYMWRQLEKKAFNLHLEPNWESDFLWFENASLTDKQYQKYDFEKEQILPLFDHQRMAELLSEKLSKEVFSYDLELDRIRFDEDGFLLVEKGEAELLLDLDTFEELPLPTPETNDPLTEISPNGKWTAFGKDGNLYVKSNRTGREKQLTFDGKKDYEYATWYGWGDILEGETRERPERFAMSWSADSKYILCDLVDLRNAEKMYLLDWSVDTLYRPRLLGYYRGSPGDETMVTEQPVYINVETGKVWKPDVGRRVHINGVWTRETHDPNLLLLSYQSRGYQKQYLKTFDLKTGALRTVFQQTSETNIDNFNHWEVKGTSKWIIASEQSGWRQLYVLDIETAELNPLTDGDYYVNDVVEVDSATQTVFFLASGVDADANPYHQQLFRQGIDEVSPQLLTPEPVHHRVSLKVDSELFVDNASTLNQLNVTLVRSLTDGSILDTLAFADVSMMEGEGWQAPMAFSTTARDGETTIFGAVWRPSNFDPSKKYPVIDHSYTGPHTQVFPKDFRTGVGWTNQPLAELGFVVVMIDGLGSSGRSKSFHDWSYKNLGGNLADHKVWIEALGAEYDWVDTSRVGIFGHSAGGYDAAHGLLAFPGFYDVGVASSADHDHRMEKAWWPEMYMGWPVDSAYHQQSNITMAGNLEGKLLITHGGIDENVNPSATFKLAEALVKADKQFDLKIFPGQQHGYRDDAFNYFTKLRWNYFVEHLRGAEPIWEIELYPEKE